MRYRRLGQTGIFVSELCLGTMTFGGGDSWFSGMVGVIGPEEAEKLIGSAVDRGINFIDTADAYSNGISEEIIGQALRKLGSQRHDLVIATKVFAAMGEGPNNRGNSRGHIMDGVKASLKRLQVDHIDLYQLHGFDTATPIEESVRALGNLVDQGYIRYIGVSNWAAWQISEALGAAERLNLPGISAVQAYYSLAGRDIERELVPMLNAKKLGLMAWSPLAGGLLSGKYRRNDPADKDDRRSRFDFPPVDRDRAFNCIDAMQPMAEQRGVSVAQIAIAWLLYQPHMTSVIIGARNQHQLDDNLAAADIELTTEELTKLSELSQLPPEYPGWMLDAHGVDRNDQITRGIRV